MIYNISDIISSTITDEKLKDIINKKLYKILVLLEIRSINEE